MTDEEDLKEGDYVIWVEGGTWQRHDTWGQVTRVTPKGTVFATYLDSPHADEKEFRQGRGVRKATAFEIRRRIWRRSVPKSKVVHVSFGLGHRTNPQRVYFEPDPTTPAEMRAATAELFEIADWWESEPVEEA